MSSPVRIVLAAEAEGDLQALYIQRLNQRGAQGADGADALLDRLFDAIASLAEFPHRGPVPPELATLGIADWRQMSVAPYRILYNGGCRHAHRCGCSRRPAGFCRLVGTAFAA